MSAQTIDVTPIDIPNPTIHSTRGYEDLSEWVSFLIHEPGDIRTISGNTADPGTKTLGLVYVPTLDPGDPCVNISAQYIPNNVTRRGDVWFDNSLVAIAPWISPQCTLSYFAAARKDAVKAFLVYQPGNSSAPPPLVSDPVWGLGDGGQFKGANKYPIYAVRSSTGSEIMRQLAAYSGNITTAPFADRLMRQYPSTDYIRVKAAIKTGGHGALPSLWLFLLVVCAALLGVVGTTSILMHWMQRRARRQLHRRIASGEVDLEELGIKRLTVPQALIDKMPQYTYSASPNAQDDNNTDSGSILKDITVVTSLESAAVKTVHDKSEATITPAPVATSEQVPAPYEQTTCAICLDDFEPGVSIVRELPCHHIFHPECVDVFLRDASSLCPLCKKSSLPGAYIIPVTAITNHMVRRERFQRRRRESRSNLSALRERRVNEARNRPSDLENSTPAVGHRLSSIPVLRTLAPARVSNNSHRQATPERGSLEMTPLPAHPPTGDDNTLAQQRTHENPEAVERRREIARQRAQAMYGDSRTAEEEDAERQARRPGWRKAVSAVFPGFSR